MSNTNGRVARSKAKSKFPKAIQGYRTHGVELAPASDGEWIGECPYCQHDDGKFYVNEKSGQYDCKHCGESGNLYTFIRHVYTTAKERTTKRALQALATERHVSVTSLEEIGLAHDAEDWLWPTWNGNGGLGNLTRLVRQSNGGFQPFNTASLKTGPTVFPPEGREGGLRFIVEGWGDACAIRDFLEKNGVEDYQVIALPGAGQKVRDVLKWCVGCRVVLLFDHDNAGRQATQKLASLLTDARSVHRLAWDMPIDEHVRYDIRDLLYECGLEDGWQYIQDHLEPIHVTSEASESGGDSAESDDPRPIIFDHGVNEDAINEQMISHLSRREDIYNYNGELVRLRHGTPIEGEPKDAANKAFIPLGKHTMRSTLEGTVRFKVRVLGRDEQYRWRFNKIGTERASEIIDRGVWSGIRQLKGRVNIPVFRSDGSLLTTPGYDLETQLYYEPDCNISAVKTKPTERDVKSAVRLLREAVCDFPFGESAGIFKYGRTKVTPFESAWIAALLTAFVRYAINSPTPLFLIDANDSGTGKSILAYSIIHILTGQKERPDAYHHDDEEMHKLLTSLTLEGRQEVLFDNVAGSLGTPSLDRALTSTQYSGRVLGSTRTVTGQLCPLWMATANNVTIRADIKRRTMMIRLLSPLEHPEERPPEEFRHYPLELWVLANRNRLIHAALTLIQAYRAAGCPKVESKSLGTYEQWISWVVHPLIWAGLPDPLLGRAELEEREENEFTELPVLMEAWDELVKATKQTNWSTSDIIDTACLTGVATSKMVMENKMKCFLAEHGWTITNKAREFGVFLGMIREKVHDNRCFRSKTISGKKKWYLAKI